MRSRDELAMVKELKAGGRSVTEIARLTGVPRGTIRDWLAGKTPRKWLGQSRACASCGHPDHLFGALPDAYVYLLGIYLGDGCISASRRGVFRLRIVLDLAHPRIVDECEWAIGEVMPHNKVYRLLRKSNYVDRDEFTHVEVSAYSKAWPCLLPQHGSGRKHERQIKLVEWQQELVRRRPDLLLRGLIHSDGCRFMNTGRNWRHPRYVFNNHSDDIRGIFRYGCDVFGVRWTNSRRAVYVSRVADVARLDQVIGPKS